MKERVLRKKGLAVLIVLVLLCTVCLGVALLVGNNNTLSTEAAAGDKTFVNVATTSSTVAPGKNLTLRLTVSSNRTNTCWAAFTMRVYPITQSSTLTSSGFAVDTDAATQLEYTPDTETFVGEDAAELKSKYALNVGCYFDMATPYIEIGIAANDVDKNVDASRPVIIEVPLKVLETATNTAFRFSVRPTKTSSASYGNMTLETDYANATSVEITSTANISVKAAGNDATLKGVKIAAEGQALSALTVADSMTWKGEMSTGKVDVSPEANDANAKITIGTTANPTTAVANNAKSTQNVTNGSVTVYIKVTAEDGTTTKTYQIAVTNTYVRLDASNTKITGTNSAIAFNNMPNVGFSGNGGKLNEDSTADQIINVPSDAKEITFQIRVKGGYGISDEVRIAGNGCSVSSQTLAGVSGTTGATVKVSNFAENSTFTVTATAKDGTTTQTYTFKTHLVSVDTSIQSFTVTGIGQGKTYNNVATQADGINAFYFLMPSTSQYKGTLNITAKDSGANITVNGANYSATTQYDAGPQSITVRVTAPAGNYKDYPVTLAKDVPGGEFKSLEVSIDNGSTWTKVFQVTASQTESYDPANLTYTRRVLLTQMGVGDNFFVKYEADDGITVTSGGKLQPTSLGSKTFVSTVAFGGNEFRLTATNEKNEYKSYTFIINLVEDKNTIEGITVKDQAGTQVGADKFAFNKTQKSYAFSVPYKTSALTFDITVDGEYTIVRTERDGILTPTGNRVHNVTRTLNVGANTFEIHAISNDDKTGTGLGEDGEKYTIVVTRGEASSDNALKSLTVKAGGETLTFRDNKDENNVTFDPSTLQYFVFIPTGSNISSVDIEAEANDENAEITGTGTGLSIAGLSGSAATVSFPIKVKAQDGTEKTYTVFVAREAIELDSNYDITDIRVNGNIDGKDYLSDKTTPSFNPNTLNYTIDVPYAIDSVTVYVNENSPMSTATITGGGRQELNVGANTIVVYATAQDGTNNNGELKKYTITVNRAEASKNTYLQNIAINGKTIDGFDKEVTNYTVRFGNDVKSINLLVESEDPRALIQIQRNGEIVGEHINYISAPIDLGEAGITVTINLGVSLDGSSKIYTLQLLKASETPILTYLSIGPYDIFDKDGNVIDKENPDPTKSGKGDYYVEIEHNLYTLLINARTDDPTAIMRIDKYEGTNGFATGELNVDEYFKGLLELNINIVIRPLIGQDAVYNLHIKRKPAPTSNTNATITIENISSDNQVGHNGYDKIADFNTKYTDNYNLYGTYGVSYNTEDLDIKVVLEDLGEFYAKGTYKIYYNETLKSDNGEKNDLKLAYGVNLIAIDILASDGNAKRTVGIVVVRGDVAMERVRIQEIYAFQDDYNHEIDEYFYAVGNNVTKLTFEITVNEDLYDYEVEGADNLKVGMNTVKIKLYANTMGKAIQRDPIKEITLMVYRAEKSNDLWMIFFWVLLAIAIVELIIIIILAIVVKKRNKKDDDGKNNNNTPPAPIVNVMQAPQEPTPPMLQQPQIIQPMPIMPPVQYVQPIQQVPVQMPQQTVQAQPAPQDPKRPVNVQVKITGMGDNDGTYDPNKR